MENIILTAEEFLAITTGNRQDEHGDIIISVEGTKAILKAVQRFQKQQSEPKEKKPRKPRRRNLHIGRKEIEQIRRLAKKYPKATLDEISVKAGLYERTISNNPNKYWVEDWNVELKLSQIVKLSRLEFDRRELAFSEFLQMGITNKFRQRKD